MKLSIKAGAICLAAGLLAACGTQLEKAERVTPEGSAFNKNLHGGYVELAKGEFGEGDYKDSDTFAGRAIQAGGGAGVEPEKIDARNLPADKLDELAGARERLMAALAAGAAEAKPVEAARAQVMFDCWMQEQEENIQPEDIAACRDGFLTEVAKLEEQPKIAAAPAPAPARLPGPYIVYFDFNQSQLNADAVAVLTKVVKEAQKAEFKTIVTSGHTDQTGASSYNDALSQARAETVARFLVDSGIAKSKVLTSAYGENNPAVAAPRSKEARNRRVEIQFTR